ncbi:hypothetical protein SAMN04488124_2906 [Halogeometricum limi]|uniref:Uncharacterized protein n=2 Tax=Halogeometricum limi TaxID=555875 RepID=A0A1I6IAS3_9EURY|nr:hypothetical protein SAMN04488124_2906 [Halogeometricum limi]
MNRALRVRTGAWERDHATDSELVELTDRPFESVADVRTRLDRLEERLRERNDRRAVFLTVYARMTREMQRGIEDGAFSDAAWMRAYVVSFAEYYRRAFSAFERGRFDAVPDPWRIAFGTAVTGDNLVVQDAFLGINAHINYDLALALCDVRIDPDRRGKYADHVGVDDVLLRLVDAQQDALTELYAPGIADVDAALGRFDETVSYHALTEGRIQAWRIAVVLTDFEWLPVERYARWTLRATAVGGASLVRSPGLDPTVLRALRRVERVRGEAEMLDVLERRLDAAVSA